MREDAGKWMLKLVGLENTGKKKAKNFSLGMKQRLGIAVALAGDPDFLVLDEPVNGLDPQGIIEMRELILKLNREYQITVLISSHILDELSRLATHYGFIDNGRMVKEISAEELEESCRKCVRIEVTNVKALVRVLDEMKTDYNIISDNVADIFAKINISKLTLALSKENCEVISMQERDESLESYYVGLVEVKTMSKLLSANFIRLKKDKFFWSGLVFMLAAGIFFPVMRYMDMRQTQTINRIDNGFFGCALFIGIVMAVFCSLFIGTEYSEGTIRNKIIIGQKRGTVYLSNFITCSLVSVVMCMAFFIPYLCIGIPLLGFFEMDIKIVLLFAVTVLMTAIVFSSIFTLISMLNNNKAVTAVICILTAFLFLIIGAQLHKMLSEPETNMALVMTDNGQEYQELPNPKFLDGGGRKTVQFFYDFLPGGQVVQCTSLETENLSLLPVYSLVIVVLTTSAGMFFFKKKELK